MENNSETTLVNPYLGTEFYLAETPWFFELGLRIPIMPQNTDDVASFVSTASDINRLIAFYPKVFPVLAAINYRTISTSNILFRARIGAGLLFNAENFMGSSNTETIFDYCLQTGYTGQKLNALVGISGGYLATLPDCPVADRYFHQFDATLTVPVGKMLPGVHIKLPLNYNAGEIFDDVIGINFAFNFN